jgi:ABC-type amino acid transport substrate-binding protein
MADSEVRSLVPARRRRLRLVIGMIGLLCLLVGCGLSFPADPDHTLDRVRGGVLRVGVSPNDPWIVWSAEPEPSGREADLVRRFAASLDADVEWSRSAEETLISQLERGELDLVAAGMTAETPWTEKAAISKPYATVTGPDGSAEEHVLAVPLGENAFLVSLERFFVSDGRG